MRSKLRLNGSNMRSKLRLKDSNSRRKLRINDFWTSSSPVLTISMTRLRMLCSSYLIS